MRLILLHKHGPILFDFSVLVVLVVSEKKIEGSRCVGSNLVALGRGSRWIFLLFTASVWSRPPGPPAVPGVFIYLNIYRKDQYLLPILCKYYKD